eukprot:scaffold5099_cov303-Pinguiococcus_pyrenoidosus.AAC.1
MSSTRSKAPRTMRPPSSPCDGGPHKLSRQGFPSLDALLGIVEQPKETKQSEVPEIAQKQTENPFMTRARKRSFLDAAGRRDSHSAKPAISDNILAVRTLTFCHPRASVGVIPGFPHSNDGLGYDTALVVGRALGGLGDLTITGFSYCDMTDSDMTELFLLVGLLEVWEVLVI